MTTQQTAIPSQHRDIASSSDPSVVEQAHRAGIYSLLGALLRDYPNGEVLAYTAQLGDTEKAGPELEVAVSMLGLAARHTSPDAIRDEYHALFIGLGRGELVPYGSWYQTGFLMEKPLGILRADLARLGFERNDDVHEPEDHIAALCEVMAFLIGDATSFDAQREFFESHLGNWGPDFFNDLEKADSACFYRSVARLGAAFLGIESRYLSQFG
jgi:TorA maturation chaperone TorD